MYPATVCTAFLLSATVAFSQEAEDVPLADKQARDAHTQLMGTTDFAAMVSLVQGWQTNFVGLVRQSLLDVFVSGMESKKPVSLKTYGTMTVLSRNQGHGIRVRSSIFTNANANIQWRGGRDRRTYTFPRYKLSPRLWASGSA
jgi:hypothetical protein